MEGGAVRGLEGATLPARLRWNCTFSYANVPGSVLTPSTRCLCVPLRAGPTCLLGETSLACPKKKKKRRRRGRPDLVGVSKEEEEEEEEGQARRPLSQLWHRAPRGNNPPGDPPGLKRTLSSLGLRTLVCTSQTSQRPRPPADART